MRTKCAYHLGVACFVGAFGFSVACYAPPQSAPSTAKRPISKAAGESEPIDRLPAHVQAPAGQLTLFADFEHPQQDGIVLYLVNRTDSNLAFQAQDGDPYVRLEAQGEGGEFQRAQLHNPSDCGNSYFYSPIVKRDQFSRMLGYQSASGERTAVRYRMFLNEAYVVDGSQAPDRLWMQEKTLRRIPIKVISNTGEGRASATDTSAARYDSLALKFGDYQAVKEMALGQVKAAGHAARWRRNDAVEALGRFATDDAAELVQSMVSDHEMSQAAVYSLAKMGLANAKAETGYQALLRGPDPELRATAIAALATRPVSFAVIEFGKLRLADPDSTVRTGAIAFLAQIANENPAAKQALMKHKDADPSVQSTVDLICKQWKR